MKAILRVTAAIIANGGKILIAQRRPGDRMAGLWEFPGGKIEDGETPQQCLKRELWEELEMEAAIGKCLGTNICLNDEVAIELMVFRAYWNGRPFRCITPQACRWATPDQLAAYSFTPADLPFVRQLANAAIDLE